MTHERKEPPTTLDRTILPPNMNYWYFEHAEDYPFDYNAETFSPVNAWWLADASFLSYAHPGFARLSLYIAGLQEFRFFEKDSTECFVASNDKFAIVSFRGTEIRSFNAISDIFTDINFQFTECKTHGRVHKGFQAGLESVWEMKDGLHQYLVELRGRSPELKFWFTGHSLGGALATLASDRFENTWGLYTYGAPKVGDIEFAEHWNVRAWRVVNCNDTIPLLPPNLFFSSKKEMYAHVGKPVFIDEHGKISFEMPGEETLLSRFKDKTGAITSAVKKANATLKKQSGAVSSSLTGDIGWYILTGEKKVSDLLSGIKARAGKALKSRFKDVRKSVSDFFKGDVSDHAPIYYSVHLWNTHLDNLGPPRA